VKDRMGKDVGNKRLWSVGERWQSVNRDVRQLLLEKGNIILYSMLRRAELLYSMCKMARSRLCQLKTKKKGAIHEVKKKHLYSMFGPILLQT
jgi:hypothetical protein